MYNNYRVFFFVIVLHAKTKVRPGGSQPMLLQEHIQGGRGVCPGIRNSPFLEKGMEKKKKEKRSRNQ